MKRIKLVFAVGVVMAALLALNAGVASADELMLFDGGVYDGEIEDVEIESDGELDIEFEDGGDIETDDIFGFDLDDEDEVILVGDHLWELD